MFALSRSLSGNRFARAICGTKLADALLHNNIKDLELDAGLALKIDELRGITPVESIDLSLPDDVQASMEMCSIRAIIVAACIRGNPYLRSLRCMSLCA